MFGWGRPSVWTDPDPHGMITKKKRCTQLQSDGYRTCPFRGLVLGSACGHSLACGMHAARGAVHAWCDQRVRGDKRERMTNPRSLWEEHGSASVCTICYSHDGWPWASSSGPAYVFWVYVSFWVLHMFYLNVAYVAMAIYVCCKCVFQIFQLFHPNIACFYLDIAYV
jgi:hypothetical protein